MDAYKTPESNVLGDNLELKDPEPYLIVLRIWVASLLYGVLISLIEYIIGTELKGMSFIQTFLPVFAVGYYSASKTGRIMSRQTRLKSLFYFYISVLVLILLIFRFLPLGEINDVINSLFFWSILLILLLFSFAVSYFGLYYGEKLCLKNKQKKDEES